MNGIKIVYHGSNVTIEKPEIRIAKYYKDFGFGFYCTEFKEQAIRWAGKFSVSYVNEYVYTPNQELKVLEFSEMTDAWLDFVVACRHGGSHGYDIVEGPMADDQIYNYVDDFIIKNISRQAFWELVKFKYPTHQISFNTEKALKALNFKGSESYDKEE